jgi:hypothetical protein
MPLLFLSHADVDSAQALELVQAIEASPAAKKANLHVWIDKRTGPYGLQPGLPWQDELANAIQHSDAFAVLLTDSGAREWGRTEIREAVNRVHDVRRAGGRYPFIPIFATDPVKVRLPPFVGQFQGVKLGNGGTVADIISAALALSGDQPVALVAEPFRGLEAFDAESAALFFGRRQETADLIARLKATTFVMVVGDSGSGKSSLVKAGLVPAFREGAFADPLAGRPKPDDWHVVEMRPGNDAFEGLVASLERAAKATGKSLADAQAIARRVREKDPRSINDGLRQSGPDGANLLLVVDQFEELWTLAGNDPIRHAFLDALLAATEASNVRIVATMRRDYFHLCSDDDGLRARLAANDGAARFVLGAMSEAGLRDAVEKPLGLAGIPAAEATALADKAIRDVAGQPGNLALLEMALTESWLRRDRQGGDIGRAYDAIGGLEGALAAAADDVFWNPSCDPKKLSADGRHIAEALFMRLVRLGDAGGTTRRPVYRAELSDAQWTVAQQLATRECRRLLVIRGAGGSNASVSDPSFDQVAELAHEQLATQWPVYRAWLTGGAIGRHGADPLRGRDKRTLDRLIERTASWAASGRKWADLPGGASLIDFREVSRRRPLWLSPSEKTFVRKGRRARASYLSVGAAAALGIFWIAGWIGFLILLSNDRAMRIAQEDATQARTELEHARLAETSARADAIQARLGAIPLLVAALGTDQVWPSAPSGPDLSTQLSDLLSATSVAGQKQFEAAMASLPPITTNNQVNRANLLGIAHLRTRSPVWREKLIGLGEAGFSANQSSGDFWLAFARPGLSGCQFLAEHFLEMISTSRIPPDLSSGPVYPAEMIGSIGGALSSCVVTDRAAVSAETWQVVAEYAAKRILEANDSTTVAQLGRLIVPANPFAALVLAAKMMQPHLTESQWVSAMAELPYAAFLRAPTAVYLLLGDLPSRDADLMLSCGFLAFSETKPLEAKIAVARDQILENQSAGWRNFWQRNSDQVILLEKPFAEWPRGTPPCVFPPAFTFLPSTTDGILSSHGILSLGLPLWLPRRSN